MGHYADLYTKTRNMLNWHGHDSCLSRSATANSFGRGNGVTRFQKIKVCVSRTNWVYRIDDYYRKHYLNTAIHTFNLRIYLQSLIRTPWRHTISHLPEVVSICCKCFDRYLYKFKDVIVKCFHAHTDSVYTERYGLYLLKKGTRVEFETMW